MGRPDNVTDLNLDDFVAIATDRGLATAEELEQFATSWRTGRDAGLDGFGDETELDDWIGGLEAWRALRTLLAAARRENPDLANKLEAWMRGNGSLPEFEVRIQRKM
jgi:hypothetical protein